MTSKHTPTPWHTVAKTSVADSNDYGICEVATSNKTQMERQANAALICKAVNMHAGLVEGLSNALNILEHGNKASERSLELFRAILAECEKD